MRSSSIAAVGKKAALWSMLVTGAALTTGCGPRYLVAPISADTAPPAEPPAVYIIVQSVDEEATAPVEVKEEAWVPSVIPARNPFERFRTWVGDYDCVQGNTGMALRILDVHGRVVRAVFDFKHAPSGASGAYLISGTYDPNTRRVHFDPSKWIVQPEDYVMVSMEGEVSVDDSLFAGKITFPGCGAFNLKPTR